MIETVLSDDGREFCGRPDQHPYELFLQLVGIEHKTSGVGRPQSNGIAERLHRTPLTEHFRIQGRTVWYESIEEMQRDLDAYLPRYNRERPHQGRASVSATILTLRPSSGEAAGHVEHPGAMNLPLRLRRKVKFRHKSISGSKPEPEPSHTTRQPKRRPNSSAYPTSPSLGFASVGSNDE